jgi:hypothetical protein
LVMAWSLKVFGHAAEGTLRCRMTRLRERILLRDCCSDIASRRSSEQALLAAAAVGPEGFLCDAHSA